jgi:hypothetical protein
MVCGIFKGESCGFSLGKTLQVDMKIEVSSSKDAMTIPDYIAFGVLLALMLGREMALCATQVIVAA